MKRLIVLYATVSLIAFIFSGTTFAQEDEVGKNHYSIFGAFSKPTGDFGDDIGEDAGMAKTGFGAGIEYNYAFDVPGLYWVTSFALILNGYDDTDIKEELADEFWQYDVDVKVGRYYNFPWLTGIKYQKQVSPKLHVYGMGQIAFNFAMFPGIEVTVDGESGEISTDFSSSYGFAVGGGVILEDKFNFGLRIYSLGEAETDVVIDVAGESEPFGTWQQPISMILITAGINF